VRVDDIGDIIVRASPEHRHKTGLPVWVTLDPASLHLFDAETGTRLNT
jgi:hypothetical protein